MSPVKGKGSTLKCIKKEKYESDHGVRLPILSIAPQVIHLTEGIPMGVHFSLGIVLQSKINDVVVFRR